MCRVSSANQYRGKWEEKKALFDEKTRSMWPNADLNARAELTRERVVKHFCLSSVEDKFDLDNAI